MPPPDMKIQPSLLIWSSIIGPLSKSVESGGDKPAPHAQTQFKRDSLIRIPRLPVTRGGDKVGCLNEGRLQLREQNCFIHHHSSIWPVNLKHALSSSNKLKLMTSLPSPSSMHFSASYADTCAAHCNPLAELRTIPNLATTIIEKERTFSGQLVDSAPKASMCLSYQGQELALQPHSLTPLQSRHYMLYNLMHSNVWTFLIIHIATLFGDCRSATSLSAPLGLAPQLQEAYPLRHQVQLNVPKTSLCSLSNQRTLVAKAPGRRPH
jgi:hypothetical protein